MNITELLVLNFEEVRRRSILTWRSLPQDFFFWKPDTEAESFLEVIRHVLSCEHLFHMRIINRKHPDDYSSPWSDQPIISLEKELRFAASFRNNFLNMVRTTSIKDLEAVEIHVGGEVHSRKLGDYLLRAAYHEAVHAGQFLANLRKLGVHRPNIWD